MFGNTGNIEEELIKLISDSLIQRRIDTRSACDSNAYMSVAWDMREDIYIENIELVRDYMRSTKEVTVNFEGNDIKVNILKAGIREKNGEGMLIFQYQLARRLKDKFKKKKKKKVKED